MFKKILLILLALAAVLCVIGAIMTSQQNLKGSLFFLIGIIIAIPCGVILLILWGHKKLRKYSTKIISDAVGQSKGIGVPFQKVKDTSPVEIQPYGIVTGDDFPGINYLAGTDPQQMWITGNISQTDGRAGYPFSKHDIEYCRVISINESYAKFLLSFYDGKQAVVTFENEKYSNGMSGIVYGESMIGNMLYEDFLQHDIITGGREADQKNSSGKNQQGTASTSYSSHKSSSAAFIDYGSVSEGDEILFGKFVQDDNQKGNATSIKWIVIKKNQDSILLLSKYCLTNMQWHNTDSNLSWEKSLLRDWLNNTFMNMAFNIDERKVILRYRTNNGIYDNVFVLNSEEVNAISKKDYRICSPTEYARQALYTSDFFCYWWLRSITTESGKNRIQFVNSNGEIPGYGKNPTIDFYGVRPAILIKIRG